LSTEDAHTVAAGMLETVREMLTQDADPMVVSNCMSVIQKVRDEGCH